MLKSKCIKVKNPCKICLKPVTQKNGLQCQGVCATWVHFNCIHYTPGKIKDIKTGVLKINCPCPDCKTEVQKEYYTDEETYDGIAQRTQDAYYETKTVAVGTKRSEPFIRFSPKSSIFKKRKETEDIEVTAGDAVRGFSSNGNLESKIDQVCVTVGQLSQQINNLMLGLKETINCQNLGQKCTEEGSRLLCLKPCYCSENRKSIFKKK